jgi:hypothetical protein
MVRLLAVYSLNFTPSGAFRLPWPSGIRCLEIVISSRQLCADAPVLLARKVAATHRRIADTNKPSAVA